ncbi:hypothetical protein C0Q70_16851 [Pomacea canaliculata]|uniref:PARP n=1 Tax=Pomacea canaliculata TaxID=400727 RepID=A0A2T7NQX9_POMCA|nr:hypothetical protein C0Q70_16851 [Pomacea canaliculata]
MAEGDTVGESATKSVAAKESAQSMLDLDTDSRTNMVDCFGRPGSQLAEKQTFKNKTGETICAFPVIVDFRRVLDLGQVSEESGVIPGISNRDLLHAVVGLYDVNLSDMTADCLYSTICEKWARTILLVRDVKDAIADLEKRRKKEKLRRDKEKEEKNAADEHLVESDEEESDEDDDEGQEEDEEDDVLDDDHEKSSMFEDVYSDTEEEEEEEEEAENEEEEEEEEEEDFSRGVKTFVKKVASRRLERESNSGAITEDQVGIETRLLGCATFEKKYACQHKERVVHLTLISVRKRAQKFCMGKYLLSKCMDPTVVGHYDAVVVHADNSAIDFFKKYGFSDDVVLNSKWRSFMFELTDVSKKDPELCEVEEEFSKWQRKTLEAYQNQICCVTKMRHEITQLKKIIKKQSDLLSILIKENEKARRDKLSAEHSLLIFKLETACNAFKTDTASSTDGNHAELTGVASCCQNDNGDNEIKTEALIQSLIRQCISLENMHISQGSLSETVETQHLTQQQESSKPSAASETEDLLTCFDISTRFQLDMSTDKSLTMKYEATSVIKASLPQNIIERFHKTLKSMANPDFVTQLYFCGTLEKPHRCTQVLKTGFLQEDFSHGEYGYGLYFSKHPSKAAQFSALGKLVLAEVGLGAVETITKSDRTRKKPSDGMDSIIVPGRLCHWGRESPEALLCQEYVVFNIEQVTPVCLITYQAVKK